MHFFGRNPLQRNPLQRISALLSLLFVALLAAGCALPPAAMLTAVAPAADASAHLLQQLPLSFEPNEGQMDASIAFRGRGAGFEIRVAQGELHFTLAAPHSADDLAQPGAQLQMQLVGGAAQPVAEGRDPLPGKMHYLTGADPSNWRTHIPTYARLRLHDVYPNIDMELYGDRRALEYDFVVAPEADPATIRLRFAGADEIALDEVGNLLLTVGGQPLLQHKPVLYQMAATQGGARQPVEGAFILHPNREIGFRVGEYDRQRPLIIDPIIAFSTFLGGSGSDVVTGVAVDNDGNIYLTGRTTTPDLANELDGSAPLRPYAGSGGSFVLEGDAFVAKLNPSGSELIYFTYLGGEGGDAAFDLVVDGQGRVALTGATTSVDFPVSAGAFQPTAPGRQPGNEYIYTSTNGGAEWSAGGDGIRSAPAGFFRPGNLIHALVVDPTSPTTLYAATRLGVYRSEDGGATWEARTTGMTDEDFFPSEYETLSLAVNPATPTTLYAGTDGAGLYKTTDGGGNWSFTSAGFGGTITNTGAFFVPAVTVNPINPQVVHAGTAKGIFRSTDGGTTWSAATLPVFEVSPPDTAVVSVSPTGPAKTLGALAYRPIVTGTITALVVAPSNPSILYAGTERLRGILKSTDSGVTYTQVYTAESEIVYGLAVDPTNPNIVYAAVGNTLLKTTNGGTVWNEVEEGFSFFADARTVAIDPSNPAVVYAGTESDGVYKSTNGGAEWNEVNEGLLNRAVRALAVDPTDPTLVYVGTESATGPAVVGPDAFVAQLSASGADLLYATFFGGFANDFGRSIARDPNGALYVAGYTLSDDLATTGAAQTTRGGGLDLFAAKFDPAQSGAASLRYATYLGGSRREGEKTVATDGTFFRSVSGVAIAVDGAGRAYLTSFTDSDDYPTTTNAFDRTFNGGEADAVLTQLNAAGSQLLYSTYFGGSGPDPTNSFGLPTREGFDGGFAIDLDGAGRVYVAGDTTAVDFPTKNALQPQSAGSDYVAGDAFVAKFDLTQSGAASLSYSTYLGGGRDDGATALAVRDDGVVTVGGFTRSRDFPITAVAAVVCTVRGGVYRSTTGAEAWSEIGSGLTTNQLNAVAVHPTRPEVVYAGGEDSRFGVFTPEESAGGLFRSGDGGHTWVPITNGLTIPTITGITFDPATPTTLYVTAGDRFTDTGEIKTVGGVFKSIDAGATWARLPNLPEDAVYTALVVDPNAPNTLYVIGRAGDSEDLGLLRSTDGGQTWTLRNNGLPAAPPIAALTAAPTNPTTFYLVLDGFGEGEDGIYRSSDGGAGWTAIRQGLPESAPINDLVVDPKNPTTLYVTVRFSGDASLYKSTNGGNSWQRANNGLPDAEVGVLAIDPQTPTTLYVGVGNSGAFSAAGVYKSGDGGATWQEASTGLPLIGVLELAVSPSRPSDIYAATRQSITANDLFVAQLNAAGDRLTFATFLGGGGDDDLADLAVADGTIYVAGLTNSVDYPATAGALQPTYVVNRDEGGSFLTNGFLTAIDLTSPVAPCAATTYLPLIQR
jgi:photosystem II stability/assembly factor-like uncharacterized protein